MPEDYIEIDTMSLVRLYSGHHVAALRGVGCTKVNTTGVVLPTIGVGGYVDRVGE